MIKCYVSLIFHLITKNIWLLTKLTFWNLSLRLEYSSGEMNILAEIMADRSKLLDLWVQVDYYCSGMMDIGASTTGSDLERELREFIQIMEGKLRLLTYRSIRTRDIERAIVWTREILWHAGYNLRRLNDTHY